ncbi:paeninodin family lasso peptide [Bacillus sp. FJAT-50079]|nr:paeninodin family lasso peptide [Bacillus sp. FJAT-50079]MBS4209142.1 paeninodin family lasso peptide [Bacillus sp. FJAT-50079]
MKKSWKNPELETLDISMTMKFWPPKDPKPEPEPGEPTDPTDPPFDS